MIACICACVCECVFDVGVCRCLFAYVLFVSCTASCGVCCVPVCVCVCVVCVCVCVSACLCALVSAVSLNCLSDRTRLVRAREYGRACVYVVTVCVLMFLVSLRCFRVGPSDVS